MPRSKRFIPPDSAEIESWLDFLARLVDRKPHLAELAMPLWRRCERELAAARAREDMLAAARERVRRLNDRTEAQVG